MKILVYGFGPYRQFSDNITEKLLAALPEIDDVEKIVFDVAFDRAQFEQEFDRAKPDVILGLGQHPRARKIRVERRSRDARSLDGKTRTTIDGTGDKRMSLRIPQHEATTITYDAGDYVCNFSMWVAEAYAEAHAMKAGFLHIPRELPIEQGVEFLTWLLSAIRDAHGGPSGPDEGY